MTAKTAHPGAGRQEHGVNGEGRLMAERDLQKELEAMKEDLSKLRSDIANLTQKLLDMGKSEAGSARNRIETEARNLMAGGLVWSARQLSR
jgi:Skp family chaperone for outer membrane proteins